MHRRLTRPLAYAAVAVAVGLTGCSRGTDTGTHSSSPSLPSSPSRGRAPAAPGAVGVSATGVTTRVDAPADSTEDEYFQACHAAKQWIDGQPAPRDAQFEPYLAMVQASATGTAGSWNTAWADLTPARQAAVIVAARAGADDECG